jgi:hypothetical protein
MTPEKWPEPDNRERFEPYPNTNSKPDPAYLGQEIIEPARPENGGFKDNIREWGTGFARDQARDYALGKAAGLAAKTALGARMLGITRWFFFAEWGSLAVAVLFAVLGTIGLIQHDTILSIFILILAVIAFGIFWLVRKIRLFVERQIARAFAKFQELVRRGVARSDQWPEWYRQNKQRV